MSEEVKEYIVRLFREMGLVGCGKVRNVEVEDNPDGSATVWVESFNGLIGLVLPSDWTPPRLV